MLGWHTNRKIIVIESDDWGCWRTKDKKSFERLCKCLPAIGEDQYNRLDTFETSEDLEALFDSLRFVSDKNGKSAKITANTVVANPDFSSIRESGYQKYFYKPYTDSLQDDPRRHTVLALVRQGMAEGIFRPQLHAREHVNVQQWLKALRSGHKELLTAFEFDTFGIPLRQKINMRNNVMAAFDFDARHELLHQTEIVEDAQRIFRQIFGFTSTSFIPPAYIWDSELETSLMRSGINAIQGLPFQYVPNPNGRWYRRKLRYTGKVSASGVVNLIRNAFFEPSLNPTKDVVGECLMRIDLSFRLKKPVIIGSHRLNFIGALDVTNREKNLKLFKDLLSQIIKRWPHAEFMTSDELNSLINAQDKETPYP